MAEKNLFAQPFFVFDLTEFLPDANTVVLIDQMSTSSGEIEALECTFFSKMPLEAARGRSFHERYHQNAL